MRQLVQKGTRRAGEEHSRRDVRSHGMPIRLKRQRESVIPYRRPCVRQGDDCGPSTIRQSWLRGNKSRGWPRKSAITKAASCLADHSAPRRRKADGGEEKNARTLAGLSCSVGTSANGAKVSRPARLARRRATAMLGQLRATLARLDR